MCAAAMKPLAEMFCFFFDIFPHSGGSSEFSLELISDSTLSAPQRLVETNRRDVNVTGSPRCRVCEGRNHETADRGHRLTTGVI